MSSSRQKILGSGLKMAAATMMSRILGLVREQVIAYQFGASGLTDAFAIAYRIPNMLRDLFAESTFSSAFVPLFTELKIQDQKKAAELMWSVFFVLGFLTIVIAVLIIVFAPELLILMTDEKFISDKERFDIAVLLTRLMAPFLTLVSWAALFMGALNALKVFFLPSLMPAFFNVAMISCAIILPPKLIEMGVHPIISLGIGIIIGGLLQVVLQLPSLVKHGYAYTNQFKFNDPNILKILNRLGVGSIGIAATQINVLVNTFLATTTVVGAVSWLTYGFRLFQFPVGILGVSLAGSNMVHFSESWKKNDKENAIDLLKNSYFFGLILLLPVTVILYFLAEPIMKVIFERGAFHAHDTLQSALAFKGYLLGLPFYGLYKIFSPVFFVLDKPKIPVYISMGSILLNIVFCFLMIDQFGFSILAVGTSLSIAVNAVLHAKLLLREFNCKVELFLDRNTLKLAIALVINSLFLGLTVERISLLNLPLIQLLGTLVGLSILSLVVFSVVLLVTKEEHFRGAISAISRKILP